MIIRSKKKSSIEQAKEVALRVLRHNVHGPFQGLPRTAGWGYPEPYTRDLMIASLGILLSGDEELLDCQRRVLETLANNQSVRGHIPSLVHSDRDRGSSDTTPLFLIGVALFRRVTGEKDFLEGAVQKALMWMSYQSPGDAIIVAQQPTSDWRDEQWVYGYGLYVNTLVYTYMRLFGMDEEAKRLRDILNQEHFQKKGETDLQGGGFSVPGRPYYALWAYKIHQSRRFDLLGNSLAILSGIASPSRSKAIISWVEAECDLLRKENRLAVGLPPNLFSFINPEDDDWRPRYSKFNLPGEYHNGGIWPFACGFYIAAIVASGEYELAEKHLGCLTEVVRRSNNAKLGFGFNEWLRAQDGEPIGQDWQTWSAAMYLYAAMSVESRETPFFENVRLL
ncbi:MAG TPA: glycoside hydrolase 100 family protein [candidate division Zixibacteria bacterium]|nr:glycoside hydrolase 100 family protein [candidate division Zixibacteria bacterium]